MEDNVAHIKSENVFLQPVLQVLEKSTSRIKVPTHSKRHENYWRDIRPCHQRMSSPLADVFDFRELREEPLFVLSSQTFCQLLGQHKVVHYNRQTPNVGSLRSHQLKLSLWEQHCVRQPWTG